MAGLCFRQGLQYLGDGSLVDTAPPRGLQDEMSYNLLGSNGFQVNQPVPGLVRGGLASCLGRFLPPGRWSG